MSARKGLLLIWQAYDEKLVCSRVPRDPPALTRLIQRLEEHGCEIEGACTEQKRPTNVRFWTHGDPGADYFVYSALG